MNPDVFKIDWRSEFRRLEQHIKGTGCVVRITHDESISAWRRFDSVLKSTFTSIHTNSVAIRIDSHWHSTRFLADILSEFDQALTDAGIPPAPVDPKSIGSISIMCGNEIAGNTQLSINSLSLNDNPDDQVKRRNAQVAGICGRCKELFARGDRLLVIVHHGNVREQSSFWRDLWRRGLSELLLQGMLLIHYVAEGEHPHGDAPDPDDNITLPRDLSDETREAHAYDDLIDMLMSMGMEKGNASAMATGHVNSNTRSMNDFYNNLTSLMLRLRSQPK